MKFEVSGGVLEVHPQAVIVAGFTGRNQEAIRAHIAELMAQGMRAPDRVPAFYLVSPAVLTQADQIIVTHDQTSGEVEIAFLVRGDEVYVTLASDHTDRAAEALDIALAKQVCPKILATSAWRLAELRAGWDALEMRSWIHENGERVLYQEGSAAELLAPDDLFRSIPFKRRPDVFVVLGGTLPAIGKLRSSDYFWAELRDPRSGRSIHLEYGIHALDILEHSP